MKKIKTLFMGALLLVAGNAMADKFTGGDINVTPGSSEQEININLENAADVFAFQFDLTLPNGIIIPYDEVGDTKAYWVDPTDRESFGSGRSAYKGTINVTALSEANTYQFVYFCIPKTAIKDNSGSVANVYVNVADNYTGEGTATIKNAKTTDTDANVTVAEGATFKIISSVADGIKNIKAAANDEPVFTLGGQRVTNPKKGLYVKGGQKVVVK